MDDEWNDEDDTRVMAPKPVKTNHRLGEFGSDPDVTLLGEAEVLSEERGVHAARVGLSNVGETHPALGLTPKAVVVAEGTARADRTASDEKGPPSAKSNEKVTTSRGAGSLRLESRVSGKSSRRKRLCLPDGLSFGSRGRFASRHSLAVVAGLTLGAGFALGSTGAQLLMGKRPASASAETMAPHSHPHPHREAGQPGQSRAQDPRPQKAAGGAAMRLSDDERQRLLRQAFVQQVEGRCRAAVVSYEKLERAASNEDEQRRLFTALRRGALRSCAVDDFRASRRKDG